MRERQRFVEPILSLLRSTPAHAGKTCVTRWDIRLIQDHPRACGKDAEYPAEVIVKKGSPPRMRERPGRGCRRAAEGGITPAHAGKTPGTTWRLLGTTGSPPRMRERHGAHGAYIPGMGITPAHAGKTQCLRSRHLCERDHPRACGKDLPGVVPLPLGSRITPAHAGKTSWKAFLLVERKDHPRACGKDNGFHIFHKCDEGSPPRMRERPSSIRRLSSNPGITPAHAGKTFWRDCLGRKS